MKNENGGCVVFMKKFRPKKISLLKKLTTPFSTENRAQSGAVFRLMVDGIISLAILLIVLSALSYFQALKISASNEKFYSLVVSATNAPNGKVFVEKSLVFNPGGFSSISIRNKTNIFEECFEFQSNLVSAKVSDTKMQITFTSPIEADVYAQCKSNRTDCGGDPECCEIKCFISFGKKLVADEN